MDIKLTAVKLKHKTVAYNQHFSTKTAGYSQHFKSKHPQILGLSPEKVWTKPNFNPFITKILQFFNSKIVWTALSIA